MSLRAPGGCRLDAVSTPPVGVTSSHAVHLSVVTAASSDRVQCSSAGLVLNSVVHQPDNNRLSPLLLLPTIQEEHHQLQQLEPASCAVSQGSVSNSSSLLEGPSREASPAARCPQDAMLLLQAQVSDVTKVQRVGSWCLSCCYCDALVKPSLKIHPGKCQTFPYIR